MIEYNGNRNVGNVGGALQRTPSRSASITGAMLNDANSPSFSANSARGRRMSRIASAAIDPNDTRKCCGTDKCTPMVQTLALTMTLFATITTAQFVAAFIANSLALLGDCASMLVDTLSYGGNIWGECSTGTERRKQRNQLIASGASLVVLLGITIWVTVEALTRIIVPADEDEDVNEYIVFGFALGGLLFDLSSFAAFYFFGVTEETSDATELNMKTAMLHVFSDTLRSTTTLVESLLIWIWDFEGGETDAWASLVVSALILIGAFHGVQTWWKELQAWRNTPDDYQSLQQ